EAPHMGASTTHGNAGYLTYFRNHASSVFAPPAVWGADVDQYGNVSALQFDGGDVGMNVVGNVLGSDGTSTTYEAYDAGPLSIYELGANGGGASDVATTSLLRDGNYDAVGATVVWSAGEHELPRSLFRSERPGWWPAEDPWPWAGPDLE